ncbi:MAG TPA: DUF47 family protein [Polyangia bacterium]
MHLLPREMCFFDFFETHAAKTVEGCELFLELARGSGDVPALCAKIKEVESACDKVTHDTVAALHRVFITPIDRNDIHRLISKMDDVMDLVEGAARSIDVYEIREPSPELAHMAVTLLESARTVCEAVKCLRDLRYPRNILEKCVEINRLENESDQQLADAIAHLFGETTDPVAVIKWKEIYELIEMATDSCEDVANVIEGVVMENS